MVGGFTSSFKDQSCLVLFKMAHSTQNSTKTRLFNYRIYKYGAKNNKLCLMMITLIAEIVFLVVARNLQQIKMKNKIKPLGRGSCNRGSCSPRMYAFWGHFLFLCYFFLCVGTFVVKQSLHSLIIANSVLRISLAIYLLIFNVPSWINC